MQGLAIKELEVSFVYRCLISGRDVLMLKANKFMYYNLVTGRYEAEEAQDGQLSNLVDDLSISEMYEKGMVQ